jgi:hypothetical protein
MRERKIMLQYTREHESTGLNRNVRNLLIIQ